jgi:serine/threonine-protein kinase
VFRTFREQDSGCFAYGVQLPGGARWFVKEATNDRAQRSLDRAWAFHRAVQHPAIVPQLHRFAVAYGGRTAAVMPWREGENLHPGANRSRFRTPPAPWTGALLYDFEGDELHLIDLDEYRPGPFVLAEDRLPGSRRFMAPEEWRRGAVIDIRATVHVLGRTARLLLDEGEGEDAFRGTAAQAAVVERATRAEPGERFGGVRELVAAWRQAGLLK